MRMKALVAVAVVAGLLALPGVSTASPTLTLQKDCSIYPPDHGFDIVLRGFPPNTPFTAKLEHDGGTLGPAQFATDAEGNFSLGPFGADRPTTFTVTVVWVGGTLVESLSVNCALPTSQQECEGGGWRTYGIFRNQGDCVSFVATGGKNPPAS
jgi:hypothetical protein